MAYKTMTLGECAKYDHENKIKLQTTGWGRVSKARELQKISRKARRLAKKGGQ